MGETLAKYVEHQIPRVVAVQMQTKKRGNSTSVEVVIAWEMSKREERRGERGKGEERRGEMGGQRGEAHEDGGN